MYVEINKLAFSSFVLDPHRFVCLIRNIHLCKMYIKQIKKKNKNSDKIYTYYRLVHSYKVGKKIRHQNIVGLGSLESVDKEHYTALANRIEELLTGTSGLLFPDSEEFNKIEETAQIFADKIIKNKLFVDRKKTRTLTKEVENNYQNIDIETIEQEESKDIGGEWLVKQSFEKLGIDKILSQINIPDNQVDIAQMLLSTKLLHPSSELEAERWLKENSATAELYETQENISRYKLYKAAASMYDNKELIEEKLYNNINNIFSGKSKIVIFDLTNMYFEGQMLGSEKANFGRSKQKQSGSKLIGLALSIDSLGFVRYSKFYPGNISEPATFEAMLTDVSSQLSDKKEKPVVVMDAGIATEDNLSLIRGNKFNYDYVCVSRVNPKDYKILSEKAITITDNRDNEIALTKVKADDKEDNFLHVKSAQKQKKEESMDAKLTKRLETHLQEIKDKLSKKGTVKKTEKIHEKVGRIKGKLSRVGWLYDIKYTEDKEKGIITDISWERQKGKEKPKGEYFLRYTKNAISEDDIWQVYNLTREVESVFRVLKTDLDIRPVYHQKDAYIEPHIWLGIIAYQVVNYIRRSLKNSNITYSWTTILEKMNTMQSSIVSVNNDKNEKLYIKLCTRPTTAQKNIFDSLNFKHRPYVRKTKIVPQL